MSSQKETRARILAAALACAADARPDFTMGEVAAKASLSRQTVYLHFPDRAALLAALAEMLAKTTQPPPDAPSARARLAATVAWLADDYPKTWPVVRRLGENPGDASRLVACHTLAKHFRSEGALSPHLSESAAADLLYTLTSLSVWSDLVLGRGWDSARYKSHITFLAAAAITR